MPSEATVTSLPGAEDQEKRTELDLRPNGGIVVWIEGEKHRLRAPRLREFRKLRGLYQEAMDALSELAEEGRIHDNRFVAALEERRRTDPEAMATAEERQADRDLGRRISEATEDQALAWWAEVFAVLGHEAAQLPDVEDLPPWLGEVECMANALQHWRSVPSPSGSR